MYLVAIFVIAACVLIFGLVRIRQLRRHRELEAHSIDVDRLHALLESNPEVVVVDVRLPLDVLAHSEVIPGARRIPPKELMERAELIPKDKDSVVYCTCAGEKTARMVLEHALKLNFTRMKFLKGGLEAWKAKGYPVVRYDEAFRLDTAV